MAQKKVLPFNDESRSALCLIFLSTVVAATVQDGNEPCYIPQDGDAPIRECDPFVYMVGETLHLPCYNLRSSLHLSGDADNAEWFKDGVPLQKYGFNFTKTSLQISDSGDYMCLVGNQQSNSQKVLVGRKPPKEPPKPDCTSRYMGIYTCSWFDDNMNSTNLPTRFQLQFFGRSRGEYEYFDTPVDGKPVTVIVNATRARYFVSLCVANCLGQTMSSAIIVAPLLTLVPPPPRHVLIVPISVDQMKVSIDPPILGENEGVDYMYQYIQQRTSFAVWDEAKISDTTNNIFVLEVEGAKPYSEVCIKVAAYSKHVRPIQISEYTTPVCNYTQMAAPSVGPHHFTSYSQPDGINPELRKVNFTWEHLSPNEANGIIIKYTLILSVTSPATNASKQVYNISAEEFFFLAEGAYSDCEYRAELYAENAAGQSPPSVSTVLKINEIGVFSIKLLLILAVLLSFGFLVAGLRLFFSVKKRILPNVPEPLINSKLLRMKMESSPVAEKEVFDELYRQREGRTRTILPSKEDSREYFQDRTLTQSLLENKGDPYVKVDTPGRAVNFTKVGDYVT